MVKYFTNCFLATKVIFSNEMKQVCDPLNIDYDKVVEYALYDERLGRSHWSVPGPDGSLGFGGHCFPKDLNALIEVAKNNSVDPRILRCVWEKNLEIRNENDRDWEKMTGRAVSED
jgi:UDPglucose 6-dehydrogenase